MRLLILPVLLLSLAFSAPAFAADFQKGVDAYQRQDYATALEEWAPLADQGNANAQTYLGSLYHAGQGVAGDWKEAAKWYRLAAEQGQAFAQLNLGAMYDKGKGVAKDPKAAMKWLTLAAEQTQAAAWEEVVVQGADAGNLQAIAQMLLGGLYSRGEGVLQDKVRAYMWYDIAVTRSDEEMVGTLRTIRELSGSGLSPADLKTARRLARECVAKNYKGC